MGTLAKCSKNRFLSATNETCPNESRNETQSRTSETVPGNKGKRPVNNPDTRHAGLYLSDWSTLALMRQNARRTWTNTSVRLLAVRSDPGTAVWDWWWTVWAGGTFEALLWLTVLLFQWKLMWALENNSCDGGKPKHLSGQGRTAGSECDFIWTAETVMSTFRWRASVSLKASVSVLLAQ